MGVSIKNSKSFWKNPTVIGASITSFLGDFSYENVTVFLPAFLIMLNAPVFALGLIEGISDGLSSFARLFSGYYSDKMQKKKEIATFGYIGTTIFPAILAVTNSWPVVLFGRAFGWTWRGIRGPPRDAVLAETVKKKDLGKLFGFHRTWDTLGAIAGPLAAAYLVTVISIRQIFWLSVIPGVLGVIVFWLLVKEKKRKINREGNKTLWFSIKNTSKGFRRFLSAIFVFGVSDFSHTLLIFFAVATLTPSIGFTKAAAVGALLYVIRNIGYAAFSYPFGVLGDRFGRKKMLAFGYLVAVLVFVGFIITKPNVLVYALLFVLAGAYIAASDALEGAVTGELADEKQKGTGYGILYAVNGVGDLASSTIVSALWSLFGFFYGFLFAAIVAGAGAVMLFSFS